MKTKREINNNKFVYTEEDIPGIIITKKGNGDSPTENIHKPEETKIEEFNTEELTFEGANWYNEPDPDYGNRELWYMASDDSFERADFENKLDYYSHRSINDVLLSIAHNKNKITACELFYFDELLHAEPVRTFLEPFY
jgi:hypothetical protein